MSTAISKLQLHKLNKEEETEFKFQAMSLHSDTSTCSILRVNVVLQRVVKLVMCMMIYSCTYRLQD